MSPGRKRRVLVLMGGDSSERDVSLSSGRQIVAALDPDRYEVSTLDAADLGSLLAGVPAGPRPGQVDVVFIALHGKGGEDGAIQGFLETMGLCYTGSGVLASALAMNKQMTKQLLRGAGVAVPRDFIVRRGSLPPDGMLQHMAGSLAGGFPVFVKPNAEGSTFGCSLVRSPEDLPAAIARALEYDACALVEEYVRGMEITASVLANPPTGPDALPIVEIVPRAAFYDYDSKYAEGGSEHIIPARLPVALQQEAQRVALHCHELLECRGMSRTDLIAADGRLVVLEVNTIPGMTPTSLLPHAASHAGLPFGAVVDRIIADALQSAAAPAAAGAGGRQS